MAYSDVDRHETLTGAAITSVGDLLYFASRRPFRVLGYGVSVVGAFTAGTGAVGGTISLERSVSGGSFSAMDSLALPNANHTLGRTFERSELMRGRSPSAPEGVINGFDVNPGDLVRLRVTTAQVPGSGGSAGSYVAYILIAPRGSL